MAAFGERLFEAEDAMAAAYRAGYFQGCGLEIHDTVSELYSFSLETRALELFGGVYDAPREDYDGRPGKMSPMIRYQWTDGRLEFRVRQ